MNPRHLIRGTMDGLLSTLGVVIGAYNPDVHIIIAAGIAGTTANAISNLAAALTAEYTERYQHIRELEEAMMTDLGGTLQESKLKKRMLQNASMDALSTVFGGLIPVLPFLVLQGSWALIASIMMSCVLMGGLGTWVGYLIKQNLLASFIKLIVITFSTALICYFINSFVRAYH